MNIIAKLAGLAVFALMLVPVAANAQTYYNYNGQTYTTAQLLAHLQQLVAELQAQLGTQGGATTAHGITLATTGASDISDDSARLSGSITLSSGTSADVWFEYGESQSFGDETETARAQSGSSYTFRSDIFNLDEDETYYFRAVAESSDGDEVRGDTRSFTTDDDGNDDDDDNDSDGDEPDVTTDEADNVEDDRAELQGEVDMNEFDDGLVFFIYGQDEDLVEDIEDEYETYDDIDEDGDDLQKVNVDSSFDDDDTFTEEVTNLEEDVDYFFQICVEFENDDDDDEIICGGVEEFDTDGNNDDDDDDNDSNDEEPDVTTESASNIEDDEAELNGEVDMNDFEDGLVFFVYGEDEDMVEDVENEYDSYDDVDEDGDDLQKVQIDSSLDDSASYELSLSGLDEETEYFFQICVEYEDEDNDEALICGGVEDFETEN